MYNIENIENAEKLNVSYHALIKQQRCAFVAEEMQTIQQETLDEFYNSMLHDYLLFQYEKPVINPA